MTRDLLDRKLWGLFVIVYQVSTSRPWEAQLQRRGVFETPGILGLAATSTLVAASVGTILFLVIGFPMSLLAIIFFPVLLFGVLLGAVLAAPVTLMLFPLTYELLRGHPILAQFVIPLVGFVAGGAIMSGWVAVGILPHEPSSYEIFSGIGMISGLAGGGFFVRGRYA
jgi:hypothetical protein